MKHFLSITLFLCTLIAFGIVPTAGCNQKVTAVPVPGSRWDCNYREHECSDGCCSLGEDCGGIWPNCPAGYCCAGDSDGRLFGKPGTPRPMTKQRKPGAP